MYAIAPNVPTERNNKFAKKFEKKFPGQKLLEVIGFLQIILSCITYI